MEVGKNTVDHGCLHDISNVRVLRSCMGKNPPLLRACKRVRKSPRLAMQSDALTVTEKNRHAPAVLGSSEAGTRVNGIRNKRAKTTGKCQLMHSSVVSSGSEDGGRSSDDNARVSSSKEVDSMVASSVNMDVSEDADYESEIDSPDASSNLSVYAHSIQNHLRSLEQRLHTPCDYMSSQKEINGSMRTVLIDWLVEVSIEYQAQDQSLHLAVQLLDRFLSRVPVSRSRLQLVGVTCLLIACKIEEVCPPMVEDLVYISDQAFTRSDMLQTEGLIIQKLEFGLSAATSIAFLALYFEDSELQGSDHPRLNHLGRYFCELALLDYSCMCYLPSMVAAASVYLALVCLHPVPRWPNSLKRMTGYSEASLRPCAMTLNGLFRKAPTGSYHAVHDKYLEPKRFEVAAITPSQHFPPAC